MNFHGFFEAAAWALFTELRRVRSLVGTLINETTSPDPYWSGIANEHGYDSNAYDELIDQDIERRLGGGVSI